MKKYLNFLMLLPFAALFAACDLGDSEPVGKYAFDTNAEQILIEAKLPTGTYDADEIYIAGPFNGAEAESYVADEKWRLTQSAVNINIYGVYLDPTAFVEGTSLADGFWLYSKNSGLSLTTTKALATYTSNAEQGQRTSIVVSQWGEPVKEEVETLPVHDGYRVYVEDRAEWGAFALYAWGNDLPELFGGWPGMQPTGIETISGVEYTYFEFEVEAGLTYNLIINNNDNAVQTNDINITFGDQMDFFYVVTGTGKADFEVIEDPFNRQPVGESGEDEGEEGDGEGDEEETPTEPVPVYFYIQDNTGWEVTNVYAYGTEIPELFGKWPGAALETEVVAGGVKYNVVETTATAYDLEYNPIINGSGDQYDAPKVTIAKYNFLVAGETSATLGEAPAVKIYVDDQTGWDLLQLYSWGDGETFGGWPGATGTAETVDGKEYKVFTVAAENFGASCNLIFNNKVGEDGVQLGDYNVRADQDYFLTITAEGVAPIE